MTRSITFPGFHPLTHKPVSRVMASERRYSDRSFIRYVLDLGKNEFYHLYCPAGYVRGRNGVETLVGFECAIVPSWHFYHERPFPFSDIWIGARVKVEFGIEEESEGNPTTNRLPTGTGATGIITSATDNGYFIQYNEPQASPLTSIGYGLEDEGFFYPFQLKLLGALETVTEEDCFYLWLAGVCQHSCDFVEEKIRAFASNWLARDGGKLMRRVHDVMWVNDEEGVGSAAGAAIYFAQTEDEIAALLNEWFYER